MYDDVLISAESRGTLYGVSVGPGDPELLTLKALRVLESCPVIAAPTTDSGHERALEIASAAVDLSDKRILELRFPMDRDPAVVDTARDAAAKRIADELDAGNDVAFVTVGDASVWSTFTRMLVRLKNGYRIEVIPGVTSFCAAAAKLRMSLTLPDEPLHIVPANAMPLDDTLALPGTKVFMKGGDGLDSVVDGLWERGIAERGGMVQLCGLPGERVFPTLPFRGGYEKTYFTTLLLGGAR